MEESRTLATELLQELKASARRWFVVAIVELVLIFAITAGFLWYLALPVEEYCIEQDATDRSFNIVTGGDFDGCLPESYIQETSEKGTEKEITEE